MIRVPRDAGLGRAIAAAITLVLVAGAEASAQPRLEARLGGAFDRFEETGQPPESRGLVSLALSPEVRFASERGRVYYGLDAGTWNEPGAWGSIDHVLGASFRLDLGRDKGARVFVGARANWRRNGDAWSDADFAGSGGFANLELRRGGLTLRGGYRLDRREFPDLPPLDQTEHSGFLSANLNLESRTTVIGEVRLGAKSYAGEALATTLPDSASAPLPGGRRGSGMGPGLRSVTPPASSEAERARLSSLLVRVAQGLGERTGVQLQYSRRDSSGSVPPAVVTTPPLFLDDGVYDDPFASDSSAWRTALKHVLRGGAVIEASGSWERKQYRGVVAVQASGLPGAPREDRVLRAGLGLEIPLLARAAGRLRLALEPGYAFTRQTSNDAFYDYGSHALGLALAIAY